MCSSSYLVLCWLVPFEFLLYTVYNRIRLHSRSLLVPFHASDAPAGCAPCSCLVGVRSAAAVGGLGAARLSGS